MQTIGKIINGKYVRYGAVSVGDKLGDAAFANIVNNSSTTEEGFVPDARVVAQQQQLITQQQAQIDSLNSAMELINLNLQIHTVSNTDVSKWIRENVKSFRLLIFKSINVTNPVLGGLINFAFHGAGYDSRYIYIYSIPESGGQILAYRISSV